jgi:4-amino-4-deoxy-L-arabinose transferase-like glycosyltransferase
VDGQLANAERNLSARASRSVERIPRLGAGAGRSVQIGPLVVVGTLLLLVLVRLPLLDAPFSKDGEAREAAVIADVVRHEAWIAPSLGVHGVPEKGPLFSWWSGALSHLLGLDEATIRLAGLLLAAATLACTVALGALLGSLPAGWMAGAVLGTSPGFWRHMFSVRYDVPLVFAVSLTMLLFVWALTRERHRTAATLLAHLALAGACLAKGLAALVPTVPVIVATLAVRRDGRLLGTWLFAVTLAGGAIVHPGFLALAAPLAVLVVRNAARHGPARLLDLAPGLLFTGLLAGWLHLADQRYAIEYAEHVIREGVSWAYASGRHDEDLLKPFHWYLPKLAGELFPWVLFLPVGILAAIQRWRRDARDPIVVPLLWLALTLLVFSCFAYKRTHFLLPLQPAAALLVGSVLVRSAAFGGERVARWRSRTDVVLACVGGLACLAALSDLIVHLATGSGWIGASASSAELRVAHAWRIPLDLGLLAVGVLWASPLWRPADGPVAVFAGQALLLGAVGALIVAASAADPEDTPDRFAERIRASLPPSAELRFAPEVRDAGVVFYLEPSPASTDARDLTRLLEDAPGRSLYFVARDERFVPEAARARIEEVASGRGSTGPLRVLRVSAPDDRAGS